MKLCIDCEYSIKSGYFICSRSCKSLVDGLPLEKCSDVRNDELRCGKRGKWFKEKLQKKNWWEFWK